MTWKAKSVGLVVILAMLAAPLAAIGFASFGPLDLDPTSPTFGYLTSTPKERWGSVDLVGPTRRALNLPVILDTDVNAAALAERRTVTVQLARSVLEGEGG